MGKRKRKNHNTPFPWMVKEENLFIAPTGNEIVTDAGWEKISFKEARKLFSTETFQEWYELFLENTDISEILSKSNVDIDLDDEMEAIHLGVQLRKYIKEDIPVINDCKNAVRYLHRRYALIAWQPRNCVTAAHNLKISQATKVYSQLLWDEDWVDEEDEIY